jgi:hypothetical protein
MSRNACQIIIVLLIFITGCDEYEYTIEMTPDGDAIKRTINFSSNLPDEQKEAVKKFYREQIDDNTLSGTFRVELPNDVGGAGNYTYFDTSIGSTATYKERFRGDDNLNQHIVDYQMFVDRYIDFIINWLEFELGTEPNFSNLRTFLDKKVRTDTKNFGLYLGFGSIAGRYNSIATDEFQQRAVLYLEERNYINSGQADILMQQGGSVVEEETMNLLRDIVSEKIGCCHGEDDSDKLVFLDSKDNIKKSMIGYIRSTKRYIQIWEEEKTNKNDKNLPPPDVDVFEFIYDGAPGFSLGNTPYKVNVHLKCPYKPFKTNGQWEDANSRVCWKDFLKSEYDLPTFCYANWSEPNSDFQTRHFGRILLEGKNLAEYCYWEKSIEAGQVRQWNEFLSSIEPNMEISEMVKAFRFTDESAEPNTVSLAIVPCKLILDALSQQ